MLSHGSVSLEHIRKMLQGPEIEPDGLNRDLRLFFAMSWGLVSSPSICPMLPDKLDAQLSQVTPRPPFPSPFLFCNFALPNAAHVCMCVLLLHMDDVGACGCVCAATRLTLQQLTVDYFAEEAKAMDGGWKLPRVMMWLQKKHSEGSALQPCLCCLCSV